MTWMWLLLCMKFQVCSQVWSPQKCFAALITCVQFLSSVDVHVYLKMWWYCETLPALITSERFLSSMNSHVTLKTLFACRSLSTLSACERFLGSSFLQIFLLGFFSTFDVIFLLNFTQFFFLLIIFNQLWNKRKSSTFVSNSLTEKWKDIKNIPVITAESR